MQRQERLSVTPEINLWSTKKYALDKREVPLKTTLTLPLSGDSTGSECDVEIRNAGSLDLVRLGVANSQLIVVTFQTSEGIIWLIGGQQPRV